MDTSLLCAKDYFQDLLTSGLMATDVMFSVKSN